MPKYEGQLYAYFLFSQGHGYPLWVPEPNTQLPAAYADEGIRIGDVGIITRNGGFDFLFNICLPVDHPVNQHYGTPPGFTPLICDRHTFPVPNYFTKGSAVYGGGATARHLSVSAEATPIPGLPVGTGVGLEISFEKESGAALILSNGATRTDCLHLSTLRNYAEEHASDWNKFRDSLGREGQLYLTTGFDKSDTWETALFNSSSSNQSCSLFFDSGGLANGRMSLSRSSIPYSSFRTRRSADNAKENQALFVRGFRISTRQSNWSRKQKVGIVHTDDMSEKDFFKPCGHRPGGSSNGGGSGEGDNSGNVNQNGQSSGSPINRCSDTYECELEDFDFADACGSDISSEGSEDEIDPIPSQPYHPLNVINDFIIHENHEVNVVVTHDDDWKALLVEEDTVVPDDQTLIRRFQEKYVVFVENGRAVLRTTCQGTSHILGEVPMPSSVESGPHTSTPERESSNSSSMTCYRGASSSSRQAVSDTEKYQPGLFGGPNLSEGFLEERTNSISLRALCEAVTNVDAEYNAVTHYPPPGCHPETRREVLQMLSDWIQGAEPQQRIFWLYGPPGVGKSAIAHTIAEMGQRDGFLMSSFFFSQRDRGRGSVQALFPTIAYRLATIIPELWEPIMQAVERNPDVLHATLEEQVQRLILEPCNTLTQSDDYPGDPWWVIVVDGLDECLECPTINTKSVLGLNQRVITDHLAPLALPAQDHLGPGNQCILYSISKLVLLKGIRLRFLICSRPEFPIQEILSTDNLRPLLHSLDLDKTYPASHDIKVYLTSEFQRIYREPRNSHIQFPVQWPGPNVVDTIVGRASGLFIYAVTVIKFIDNADVNPCTQLESVLRLRPQSDSESNSPYHDLDLLYHQILSSHPQHSKVRDILWVLVNNLQFRITNMQFHITPSNIEALLLLHQGDVTTTLHGMRSILDISEPEKLIHVFHSSFEEFLYDSARSSYFSVGSEQHQRSFFARRFLRAIDRYSQVCDGDEDRLPQAQGTVFGAAWANWGRQFSRCDLDADLLDALQNVDFTRSLGRYFTHYLHHQKAAGLKPVESKIRVFFSQVELLLQRLEVFYNGYADIAQRFSDYTRGFRVRVSRPDIAEVQLNEILDAVAAAFGRFLIGDDISPSLPPVIPDHIYAKPVHFQVISIGNDCACTRASGMSSRISLPCSESILGNVYHIQISVAVRNAARIAMYNIEEWHPDPRTHYLTRSSPTSTSAVCLCSLLNMCGPCPELLDPLPSLFHLIVSDMDRRRLLKWLQSFPLEYASQTSPLIEQILAPLEGDQDLEAYHDIGTLYRGVTGGAWGF